MSHCFPMESLSIFAFFPICVYAISCSSVQYHMLEIAGCFLANVDFQKHCIIFKYNLNGVLSFSLLSTYNTKLQCNVFVWFVCFCFCINWASCWKLQSRNINSVMFKKTIVIAGGDGYTVACETCCWHSFFVGQYHAIT